MDIDSAIISGLDASDDASDASSRSSDESEMDFDSPPQSTVPTIALESPSTRAGIRAKQEVQNGKDRKMIKKYLTGLDSKRELAVFNHKMDTVACRLMRKRNTCPLTVTRGVQKRVKMGVERHMATLIKRKHIEAIFTGE